LPEYELGRRLGTFKEPCFSENQGAAARKVLPLFVNAANVLGEY
jgi:hypothetical protein